MRLRVVCWFLDCRPLQLSYFLAAILTCLSPNLRAQGLTEPVTVSRVGPEGGRINSIVVDPQDSKTVYAAFDAGVFKSADGGATWRYSGLMGSAVSTIFVATLSPATVYAAAPGNIFKSLDAGATWNQMPETPPNLILDAIDPQGTLFGRIRPTGGLFKSSDGGTTWQAAGVGIPNATVLGPPAIDPRNANTLYIAGYPNLSIPWIAVFKSTNGGASWSQIATGIPAALIGLTIDPVNTGTLYVTTQTGFLKSTDGGRFWNAINNGLTECFCTRGPLVIDPQNTATLYGVRFDGIIFKSTNGGRNWALLNQYVSVNSLTIDPRDSNTLYAATSWGAFKSTDGGVNWGGINSDLRATPIVSAVVDPQSPQTLYAAARLFTGVLKSNNKGKNWELSSSGIAHPGTIETLAIDPQTPSILYAGTAPADCELPGGVFKSVDAGLTWTDTGLVSCPAALVIDPKNPNTIYAATDSGVMKSIDGGGSWTPINAGLGTKSVTALAMDPQNPQILYAAAGTLFKSTDGGMGWNPTGLSFSVSQVTIDPENPGTVYAVCTPPAINGGIWKSIDGGTSWQDLSSALPAIPYTIALDPKNSATIYAPTDFGVIKSADGGQSWTVLTSATGSTQFLIPSPDSTLYTGGHDGLFAISALTVTAVTFDVSTVSIGSSYTTTVLGSNLNDNTYFDVQVRAPGSAEDIVVLNWQVGTSEGHSVPVGILPGTWTIDGVRAHQDPENHEGSFAQVSAAITVSP